MDTARKLGAIVLVIGAVAWASGCANGSPEGVDAGFESQGPSSSNPPAAESPRGPDVPSAPTPRGRDEGTPSGRPESPGFTISPTSGISKTVVTVTGQGCQGFDVATVYITDEGSETEGASVTPVRGDGSWSTNVQMPPAPVPGLDPYPGSWANPDHAYAVRARCILQGEDGPSPRAPRDVLHLPDQPFDLVAGPPPDPSGPAVFAGFWPVGNEADATRDQKAYEDGHQPWRGDPESVARLFAEVVAGWSIEVSGSEVAGAPAEGWTATVRFRVFIGEGELQPITAHTLRLVGLPGAEHPVWFVAGLASDHIQVDTPSAGATASSPLEVAGRASAYEGNVLVEVRDDSGQRLHSGHLQAGATGLSPFRSTLDLAPATTTGGILVLSGDRGAGPVPDMTMVRIGFPHQW